MAVARRCEPATIVALVGPNQISPICVRHRYISLAAHKKKLPRKFPVSSIAVVAGGIDGSTITRLKVTIMRFVMILDELQLVQR